MRTPQSNMTCTDAIPNCAQCSDSTSCRACQGALELPDCSKITNCRPGAVEEYVCAECEPPFAGGDCRGVQNCELLDAARPAPYCLVCSDNYRAENGVCVSICQTFDAGGPCAACKTGYFLENGVCAPCNAVFEACSTCSSGKICTGGCAGDCAHCFGSGPGECLRCRDGFALSDNRCLPCDNTTSQCICGGILRDQCRFCGKDGFRCAKCITDYRLNKDMTECLPQPYGVAMGFCIALAIIIVALVVFAVWQCLRGRDAAGQDLFSKGSGNYQLGAATGRQIM